MVKRVLIALRTKMSYSLVIKWSFAKLFQRNIVLSVIIGVTLVMLLVSNYSSFENVMLTYISERKSEILQVTTFEDHYLIVKKYLGMRENWKTSNLGTFLLKYENQTFLKKDKTFVIFLFNYWQRLRIRHIRLFSFDQVVSHVLSDCSVDNCIFTENNSSLDTADVVLVHINYGLLPEVENRNPKQIWVFFNDEPPSKSFILTKSPPKLKSWANVFNWSMTYRTNADVPVPYGRTVPLSTPLMNTVTIESIAKLIPNLQVKRSDVLVAIMISNCAVPLRMKFVAELQKHMKVDVYGNCSTENQHKCPGHYRENCVLLDQYYFYLAMENSKCRQYLTEKIFFNAYAKGAVPIVVGPLLYDCKTLLPPNSYIHYNDYESVKQLAAKISSVFHNVREYLFYHMWRNHFKVLNEHGFFGTKPYHLCRLCEALNYNEQKEKSFSFKDLKHFLNPSTLCMMYEQSADIEVV